MRRTLIPISLCSFRRSSRICAWIVTSSAVVGSSARRSLGSHASAIAIITRCRCPPESWCGYALDVSLGPGDADEPEQLDGPRRAPPARDASGEGGWPRRSASPPCRRGSGSSSAPGRSSRSRCPRTARISRSERREEVAAAKLDRSRTRSRPGGIGHEAQDRERRDALAAPALADEPDRGPVGDVERDAVDRAHGGAVGAEGRHQVADGEERSCRHRLLP